MLVIGRNLRRVAAGVACLAATMMFSCAKDGVDGKNGTDGKDGINGINGTDGRDGTDGINGTDGKDGEQGPQGIPGNNGAMMYVWGRRTFTSDTTYLFGPLNPDEVKNSLYYAYYVTNQSFSAWWPVPGVNSDIHYQVAGVLALQDIENWGYPVRLYNFPAGGVYTTPVTWHAFRVIVVPIPDSNIYQKSAGSVYPVDWSNYTEVAAYFGFPQ